MRSLVLKRAGIIGLAIVILAAIWIAAISLMKTSTPRSEPVIGSSCIDPDGKACTSERAIFEFIEAETSLTLPSDTDLLYTSSSINSLRTAAGGYAVLSLPTDEVPSAVADLEGATSEDSEPLALLERSEQLAELGADAVEGAFQHDQASVSVLGTADPNRRLLAVSIQFYY